MFVVLVLAISALGYGVATASGQFASGGASPRSSLPAVTPTLTPTYVPPPSQTLTPTPTPTPTPTHTSKPTPNPAPTPGRPLLSPGDSGSEVRALQVRLKQLQWYFGDVTDHYGSSTESAVKGFQGKRGLPQVGYVDRTTMDRLVAMTHAPTQAELDNRPTDGSWTDARLDDRCRTGHVMCIDKTSRTIRWVVDGRVLKTMAVRFGAAYTPTREGLFHVESMSRDHVSSLYGSSMPFAMFFSRGQAVHYSSDFAARGYAGASHGCVNVRDFDGIKWLFDQVQVGDKVVIYWS